MNVSEIMTLNPEAIEASAPIREAIERLYELDIRHLPVVRKGELVGIVSDRDLRQFSLPLNRERAEIESDSEILDRPVESVMFSKPIAATPADSVSELIENMIEAKIGAIPVIEPSNKALVGIVSYIDILKVAADTL